MRWRTCINQRDLSWETWPMTQQLVISWFRNKETVILAWTFFSQTKHSFHLMTNFLPFQGWKQHCKSFICCWKSAFFFKATRCSTVIVLQGENSANTHCEMKKGHETSTTRSCAFSLHEKHWNCEINFLCLVEEKCWLDLPFRKPAQFCNGRTTNLGCFLEMFNSSHLQNREWCKQNVMEILSFRIQQDFNWCATNFAAFSVFPVLRWNKPAWVLWRLSSYANVIQSRCLPPNSKKLLPCKIL